MSQHRQAEPAAATMARSTYRPDVDGLRAVAVIAVIMNHFDRAILPSGYLGVDIFFVISGFVITASLSRHVATTLADFLASFYARRVRRIMPALLVMVLVTSIAICLVDPNPGTSLITGIGSLFGASNVYLVVRLTDYFAASTELNAFLHTWSLGVEEQFYLLFPLLVWFSGFGRSRPHAAKKLVIFLLPILVASLVSFCILYPHHQPQAYFLIASRFWELAMGSLVFVACRYTNSIRNWWPGPVSLLSLAGLMATFLFPLKLALAATVIAVLLASLLILSLDRSSVSYRILSWPPLVTTGLLSYSLYLWHWPVLVISRWTVGVTPFTVPFQVGLIVLFSWLSYQYVELPFRRLNHHDQPRRKTLFLGGLISLFLAGFIMVLGRTFSHHLFLGKRNALQDQFTALAGRTSSICNLLSDPSSALEFTQRCGQPGSSAPRTVYLLGDSQIEQFAMPISSLASLSGYSFYGVWGNACPFPALDALVPSADPKRRLCLEGQHAVETEALKVVRRGDVVFIGSYLTANFSRKRPLVQGDLDRVRSDYVVKLLAIAERFVRQGATVVIYLNGPRFDGLEGSIEGYCTPQWYKATLDPSCSVSAGSFVDQRRHDFADIFKWADDSKRIVWDGVDETTCSRGVCTATHYKDEAHFRPYYANYIFHRFQQSHPDLFVPAGSDQGDRAVSDRADARR